jgi:uncharacterized protein (DUF4415 family)
MTGMGFTTKPSACRNPQAARHSSPRSAPQSPPAQRDLEVIRRGFHRPVKQQITARLDSYVLHWLKSLGKFYQSRTNGNLRKEMLAAMKR